MFFSFQARRFFKDGYQITVRVQAILLRRLNKAVNDGAALGAQGRIGEEEVLPTDDKGLDAPLRSVIAQLQSPVLQIADEIRPLLLQLIQGLAQGAFRGCGAGDGIRPRRHGVQDGLFPLQTLCIPFFRAQSLKALLSDEQLIAVL